MKLLENEQETPKNEDEINTFMTMMQCGRSQGSKYYNNGTPMFLGMRYNLGLEKPKIKDQRF